MKIGLTEVIIIGDRSGSMESIRGDAVGGLNTFIEEQKKEPGEAKFSLILFSGKGYVKVVDRVDIKEVKPLTLDDYITMGDTPLYDAIGKTIDDYGKILAETPETERPERVIVLINTDGHENASTDYTQAKVGEMIKLQTETYRWQFIYLGANQDAFDVGNSLNIPTSSGFEATSLGVSSMYRDMSRSVKSYRKTGTV